MADFSFIYGPAAPGDSQGAPRPEEIASVLSDWRREELGGDVPIEKGARKSRYDRRREEAFESVLKDFPGTALSKAGTFYCPKCLKMVTLKATDLKLCADCGGVLNEQLTTTVYEVGESLGALFEGRNTSGFHLGVDILIRSLDLPRWFLQLGLHARSSRRIPVNYGNLVAFALLACFVPLMLIGAIAGMVSAPEDQLSWRLIGLVGGFLAFLTVVARPFMQTYMLVGREKVTLVALGERNVLHYGRIEEIRNQRTLNGWGYAWVLGRLYGPVARILYGCFLQWFDPRAWLGLFPERLIDRLPPDKGGPNSPFLSNRIVMKGEKKQMVLPYHGRFRRDLTQALAVVIFQVRSLSPKAKIDIAALQAAQRERATAEQWLAGVRG